MLNQEYLRQHPFILNALALVIGAFCGNAVNLIAQRILAAQPIFKLQRDSACCAKRLTPLEMVPIIPYLLRNGRCRYCGATIHWQGPLVEAITAITFVILVNTFGLSWQGAAMIYFVCTLIVVCITDFREQLIPHHITYPAILVGILYNAFVSRDLLGALAGIGLSYILFDFVSFYGLVWHEKYQSKLAAKNVCADRTAAGADTESQQDSSESQILEADTASPSEQKPTNIGAFSLVGSGDAVLAALIAAFLGWQGLINALVISIFAGALIAAIYRLVELHKHQMLRQCMKPAMIGFASSFAVICFFFAAFCIIFSADRMVPLLPGWITLAFVVGFIGALALTVLTTARISKPFPLAPALALGAVAAIFSNPIGAIIRGGAQ